MEIAESKTDEPPAQEVEIPKDVNIYNPASLLDLQLEPSQLIKLIRSRLEETNAHPNIRKLWQEIITGFEGNNVGIPLGDDQLDRNIMIRKAMMMCIGGLPGSAKSACIDDIFVLKLFRSWLMNEHDDKFPEIEWTYFSMERSALFKRAKWLCWLMFNTYGVSLAVDDILSWRRGHPISKDLLPYIPQLLEYIDFLEDKIDLIEGEKYVEEIHDIICSKMNREGYHIYCKTSYDRFTGEITGHVYVNHEIVGTFDNEVFETNKIGTKKFYVDVMIPTKGGEDRLIRVYENTKRYVAYDPRKIYMIVVDHLSKVRVSEGENRKTTNDRGADMLAELRDYYGITVIIVNQFNREIYKEDAARCPNGIVPTETHFADSSAVIRNADLVLGIIDASRLQDWNQGNYNVQGLINSEGYCTLRTVHVVKSTYGGSGTVMGFSFIGKCGYFRSLPKADYMNETLEYLTLHEDHEYEGKSFEDYVAEAA